MSKTYDLSKIEEMTQADLEAMEDEMVAAEVQETTGEATPASTPEPSDKPAAAEPETDPAKQAADDSKEAKSTAQPADPAKPAEPAQPAQAADDDIKQHVSPPSKWAAERRAKREAQDKLAQAEAKAAKADELEKELESMREELSWIKTAMTSKGVELPKTPLDNFSKEKIDEIRDEFGDDMADMFEATAALLKSKTGIVPTAQPEVKTDKTEVKTEQPQQQQATQQPADQVPKDLLEAIDNNDELSYWRENSQPLWERAIAKDADLLKDPAYAKLSYAERFTKVVEAVKTDVMTSNTPPGKTTNDPPAQTLSNSGGVDLTQTSNDALDKILATDDPNKQMEIYNALPQDQKDQVDKALNI